MRTRLSLLATAVILSAGTVVSHAQDRPRETMVDNHYAVTAGGMLEVDASDADVIVSTGKAKDVHVRIVLEGRDMARAKDYYERQRITVGQEGNTVRVRSNPERYSMNWRDWRDHPHIRMEISLPENYNVDLRSSDGDLSLQRLRGNARMKTSDGDVTAGDIDGQHIEIRTSDGDITTNILKGETVEISTSDGDLTLGEVTAKRLVVRTSDGDISATVVSGETEVKTSDGDIRIDAFHGPSLYARTSDGSIKIDRVDARSSRVYASDGDVVLHDVDGDVDASTSSGDVYIGLRKPGAVVAKTSDGDVTIDVPKGHRADLQLRGDVEMTRSAAFDGEIERDHADGRINGGGPLIQASSADGTVTLTMR